MEAISVAVRTGTFPSPPPTFSLLLLWDAPPHCNLGADKGSGATVQGSYYMMLGKQDFIK